MKNTTSYNDAVEKAEGFRMPWGKFRGRKMAEVPDGYLQWLAENSRDDNVATKADIVMQWRDKNGIHVEDDNE